MSESGFRSSRRRNSLETLVPHFLASITSSSRGCRLTSFVPAFGEGDVAASPFCSEGQSMLLAVKIIFIERMFHVSFMICIDGRQRTRQLTSADERTSADVRSKVSNVR